MYFWNQVLSDEEVRERLSSDEYRVCRGLIEKKRADWLAGRMAAKQVIRDEIQKQGERTVPWHDIEIISDEGGRPTFRLLSYEGGMVPERYGLTLSHTGGLAVAALSLLAMDGAVGIDIEQERPYSDEFVRAFLTERECRLYIDTKMFSPLLLWCYKEAVLKALGTGLQVHPQALELTFDTGGKLTKLEKDGEAVSFRATSVAFPRVPFGAIVYLRI